MWFAPWYSVMEARHNRDLESLNPIPYAVTFLSCVAWTVYSCMLRDVFLFLSAAPGVVLGGFYALTCLTIMAKINWSPEDDFTFQYKVVERLMLGGLGMWTIIGFVASAAFEGTDDPAGNAKEFVGIICAVHSISYYAAPLSEMWTILKLKDATSLHAPTVIVSLMNAALWGSYGFARSNFNMVIPSSIGVVLSVIQLLLITKYGSFYHVATISKQIVTGKSQRHNSVNDEPYQTANHAPYAEVTMRKLTLAGENITDRQRTMTIWHLAGPLDPLKQSTSAKFSSKKISYERLPGSNNQPVLQQVLPAAGVDLDVESGTTENRKSLKEIKTSLQGTDARVQEDHSDVTNVLHK